MRSEMWREILLNWRMNGMMCIQTVIMILPLLLLNSFCNTKDASAVPVIRP